jgi:hypothetical protein
MNFHRALISSLPPPPWKSCPFLIRGVKSAKFLPRAETPEALARLPDIGGTSIGLLQKLLDLKRHKCAKKNADEENWILAAYEQPDYTYKEIS